MEEEPQTPAEGAASNHDGLNLPTGTIVGGSYIIFECLGSRADSAVYKCRHKDLAGPFLAMKILHPSLMSNEEAAARFHQEVVASYNVTHPNVVRTHEFISDDTTIAYTMEFMEYGTLKDRLEQDDPLDIEDTVIVATQICEGLQAIHNAGLIHRNIKPGNIFFSADGTVKIADFGIARSSSGPRLTSHGQVLGTVGYASPEYLETGEVDRRSDIYAFGMILYEMITDRYPFSTANPLESLKQRLTSDPVSPSEIRAECPLELSNVVLKALSRSPSQRYQSVGEMLEDIAYLGLAASVNSGAYTPRDAVDQILSEDVVSDPYVEQGYQLEEFQRPIRKLLDSQVKKRLAIGALISGVLVALCFALVAAIGTNTSGKSLQEIAEERPEVVAVEEEKPVTVEAVAPVVAPVEPTPVVAKKQPPTRGIKNFFGLAEGPSELPPAAQPETHTVVLGETINGIAQRYSVSPRRLMELNSISNPKRLEVGTVLLLR